MRVLIMGCGRVGSELSVALLDGGHDVTVIDKNPEAFCRYPPGEGAQQMVDSVSTASCSRKRGSSDADAFIAVSQATTRTSSPPGWRSSTSTFPR